MNGIVGGKLVRPAIPCRVCYWPATGERLPTPNLDLDTNERGDISGWTLSTKAYCKSVIKSSNIALRS